MLRDFLAGIEDYGRAIRVTGKYKLWFYWILPGIIAIILAIFIFATAWGFHTPLATKLVNWYPFETGKALISKASNWVSWFLILTLGVLLFKHLLMIIVAPFMSVLSEKVEKSLNPAYREKPFSLSRAFREMVRGARIALRNALREIFLVLGLSLLSIFGPIGLISGILIFLVQAYYAGFGNMDYTLERRFSVKSSVDYVRARRGFAIANGLVFLGLLTTLVGVFFAPAWSTIAASLSIIEDSIYEDGGYSNL